MIEYMHIGMIHMPLQARFDYSMDHSKSLTVNSIEGPFMTVYQMCSSITVFESHVKTYLWTM